VRRIELELEGATTVAHLLDDLAPKACRALFDALPFEDDVTHGRWSGGRLHTHRHPALGLSADELENPSVYQAPGDIVVVPGTNELMVTYAPGSYRPYHQVTLVSHVGRIDGDFSAFARKIERLQWEGAKRLSIRPAGDDAKDNPPSPVIGPVVRLEAGGNSWDIELFTDQAPKLCQAILDSLPLEGPATNTHSTGMIIHYWVHVPNVPEEVETGRERKPVDYEGRPIGHTAVAFYDPREMRAFNPGDVFFCADEGFLLLHGQGQFGQVLGKGSGRVGQAATQKVGRIVEGNVAELHALGDRIEWEGTTEMRLSLVD